MTSNQSPGPNPYTIGVPFSPQSPSTPPKVRYAKPNSFQLISPGPDNAYGQGGSVPRVTTGRVQAPQGDYYQEPKQDRDNLTNFAKGELNDEQSN
jgi:hypothetical protein